MKKDNQILVEKSEKAVEKVDRQNEFHSDATVLGLKSQKIIYRGQKYRRILEFNAYTEKQLPFKYFETLPVCFRSKKGTLVVVFYDESFIEVRVGDLISQSEYHEIERNLKFCGKKLHEINDEIKKLRAEWSGIDEVKI